MSNEAVLVQVDGSGAVKALSRTEAAFIRNARSADSFDRSLSRLDRTFARTERASKSSADAFIRTGAAARKMTVHLDAANNNAIKTNSSLLMMFKTLGRASIAVAGLGLLTGGVAGLTGAITGAADKMALMEARLKVAIGANGNLRLKPATAVVSTYAQLVALTLAEDEWAVAPPVGMFRLGGEPVGLITADVVGATDGAAARAYKVRVGSDRNWTPQSNISDAVREAQRDIQAASNVAAEAFQDAQELFARAEEASADGKLVGVEKKDLFRSLSEFSAEKSSLEAQANDLGIATEKDDYIAKYNALNTYFNSMTPPLVDYSEPTTIVRATLLQKLADFTNARTALLVRISRRASEVGNAEIYDPMVYATAADFNAFWGSAPSTQIVTTTSIGGRAIQVGDNAGNDVVNIAPNQWLNYHSEDLYEVKFELEVVAADPSAKMYLGVEAQDNNGQNLGQTYNYVAVSNGTMSASLGKKSYTGYFRGLTGATTSGTSNDRANPVAMPSGTVRIRPRIWIGYPSNAHRTIIHSVQLRKIEDATLSFTGAWSSSRSYFVNEAVDGRGVAIITEDNKFYPKGTVRSGIIWRSHQPVAYEQTQIWNTVPTYDLAVPFASQTGYSVNGGDMRIFGEAQVNGFANYRWMPWESSTYDGVIQAGLNTLNPYKVGSNETGQVPNAAVWLKYTPFNQQGRSPITGPGGTRDDRQMMAEPVARYARDVSSTRAHDNRSIKQIALDYLTGYVSDPYQCFEAGRLTPLFKGAPQRSITMRNHYYGAGEASTPAEKAYYIQGGRTYEWATGYNPLTVTVPYAGSSANKPIFGTNQIDDDHAHQFPHWGSLLWQTPEFAMLGAKFFDQSRLYRNAILNSDNASMFAERGAAWKFNHATMAWKTASRNSSRLYSRKEVLEWIVFDFEAFHDLHYASTPGFMNPPASISGADTNQRVMAATQYFGPCLADGNSVYQHEFYIGYWLSALQVGEKIGFNNAVRAASPKAQAVLDWLISIHEKRITGRLNGGMLVNAGAENYLCPIWTNAQITAAGGNVANLPHTFAAVATAQGANAAPTWDTFKSGSNVYDKDGQAMDQLLAGPSLLLDMGRNSQAVIDAEAVARAYLQEKIDSETARGTGVTGGAGSAWFKYLQTTNNAPYQPE